MTSDAGPQLDAGEPDAGGPDAGGPDAGGPDAGGLDAGDLDAGGPDWGLDGGVQIVVDLTPLGAVNRLLLGDNVEWTADADEWVDASGVPVPLVTAAVLRTAPSLLRYPGGSLADGFHFPSSILPLATRPEGLDGTGKLQPMPLGTGEFLGLCASIGAGPLFTVNVFSAPVSEAVAWVAWAQDAGLHGAPQAHYWEVGNEPYLDNAVYADGGVDTLTPAEFASRANTFLEQMRAQDPSIELSIPIRGDTLNGVADTQKPGYLDTILSQITVPFDLASVHDGYLPVDLSGTAAPSDLYLATVAGPLVLGEVLDGYRTQLDQAFPQRTVRFALTEWHDWLSIALIALVGEDPTASIAEQLAALDTDQQANSPAGAIYTADVLRLLSYRTDVELADIWSASDDYVFGVVNAAGIVRPPGLVLEAVSQVLNGQLLAVSVSGSPTLATPSVGLVHAYAAIPAVTALAAQQDGIVRLLLTNKDPDNFITIRLSSCAGSFASVTARALTAPGPLDHSETSELTWSDVAVTDGLLTLLPHSVTRIDAQ